MVISVRHYRGARPFSWVEQTREPELAERANLQYHDVLLRPDPSRTVVRPFEPSYPAGFDEGTARTQETVNFILSLDEAELTRQLKGVTASLHSDHHRDVDALLRRRFTEMAGRIEGAVNCTDAQRRLIGAYFSQEYAYEAAALFNPSAVLHPDQADTAEGEVRFLLSLRGIGEGHLSSVTFRTGRWAPGGAPMVDDPGSVSVPPVIDQADADNAAIRLHCGGSRTFSETVLFPVLPSQRQGIEDLRLVRFDEGNGAFTYHGTYTAFSGSAARSELLSTTDFVTFEMRALTGDAAGGKGMALFPRRIEGQFAMLGRHDNKNIWLLRSDDLFHWDGGTKLIEPRFPWEFVQMGNCGSPIGLDEGWLVLTHGVGTVRNYCIGACLLDKRDPSRLIARTPRPILAPSPKQRDGYVPNVVYSCGALVVGRDLLLPYAVADTFTAFATASIDDLLAVME